MLSSFPARQQGKNTFLVYTGTTVSSTGSEYLRHTSLIILYKQGSGPAVNRELLLHAKQLFTSLKI